MKDFFFKNQMFKGFFVDVLFYDIYQLNGGTFKPFFDNLVTSLESMSTKDVDLKFIVIQLFHEVSKKEENEITKNVVLINKIHKANEKVYFCCRKP
jgi:hypothetical protein